MNSRRWPEQTAVVFTGATGNVGMLLRELLRNYNWTVIETTDSIGVCTAHIRRGEAQLAIIDDTAELPASYVLRQLLLDPLLCLTPVLTFTTEQNGAEVPALRTMGAPKLVAKPLTPDKFLPGFSKLLESWSTGSYAEIRRAANQIIKSNEETGLRLLTKLNDQPEAQPLVSPCLAKYYYRNGNIKTAEKVLLVALKNAPRNMGIILALAEFYMRSAMPDIAYRLLAGARGVYGNTIGLLPDLTQACIMSNRMADAISHMRELQSRGFMQAIINDYLCKCLYAEGRESEIKKLISRATFERQIDDAWNQKNPLNAAS